MSVGDTSRLRQLVRKMINIYSPSGKEADLVEYLAGYLRRHGLPVRRQKVDGDRDNLIVEPDDTEPRLVFVGHLDTVEAFDLDDYSYSREGDEISGLGAADMKGGCAAMVEAFIRLWESGHTDLPVALALVVGEEESGDGAGRLVRGQQFDYAVVGEPTDLQPCLSHYAYLEVQLLTRGRRVHASLAPRTHNAVTSMLQLLLGLIEHMDRNHPEGILNVRNLASSDTGFAVPDRCEAWVDIHLPPRSPMGELTLELEDLVAAHRRSEGATEAEIDFHTIDAGFELPERGELVDAVRSVLSEHGRDFEPSSFRSHSDGSQLWSAGVRTIIMGPGLLEKAHTSDESVSFSQIADAAAFYYDLALSYSKAIA